MTLTCPLSRKRPEPQRRWPPLGSIGGVFVPRPGRALDAPDARSRDPGPREKRVPVRRPAPF